MNQYSFRNSPMPLRARKSLNTKKHSLVHARKFSMSPKNENKLAQSRASSTKIIEKHKSPKGHATKSSMVVLKTPNKNKLSPNNVFRKSFKTPKIMLKSPKSKSKHRKRFSSVELNIKERKVADKLNKSLTPLLDKRMSKSLQKSNSPLRKVKSPLRKVKSPLRKVESPLRKVKSPIRKAKSPIKRITDIISFMRRKSVKDTLLLKKPIVILQRLANIVPSTSSIKSSVEPRTRRSSFYSKKRKQEKIRSPAKLRRTASTPKSLSPAIKTRRRDSGMNSVQNDNSINMANISGVKVNDSNIENEEKKVKNKNDTYELLEPKTPNLRKKLQERKSPRINKKSPTQKPMKKTYKINFKSPLLNVSCSPNYRLKSTSKVVGEILNTPNNKKPETKNNSTAKKLPNFSKIHERLFAKSESVIDARKRLKERHISLTKQKLNDSQNDIYNSKKGNYNRFGFKIRKNDATDKILKERNIGLMREKRQEKNKEILKGVRTNRRFELQMKLRNIKT